MKKLGMVVCSLGALAGAFLLSSGARADGLILSEQNVTHPSRTQVRVDIVEEVATTSTELEFPSDLGQSKRFLFPVPESASVVGFAVFRNGQWEPAQITGNNATTPGEVAGSAGGTQMTQALKAYLGTNSFIIGLPLEDDGAPLRVKLDYIQILPYEFGSVSYLYPLRDYQASVGGARDQLAISLNVSSLRPITGYQAQGFFSLLGQVEQTPQTLKVLYQAQDFTPDGDFPFSYAVQQDEKLYVNLLADHEACDGADGFFLLIVEPKHDLDESQIIPKYFSFVMDTSGSMSGYKIEQAKGAAQFFVKNLNAQDRFNVITFDSVVDPLFPAPQPVNSTTQQQATSFLEGQYADSMTNLNQGLLTALSSDFNPEFARILILLTDGEPTAGVTDPTAIINNVKAANTSHTRIFPFGIGGDVNKPLLTALAAGNNGTATFLGENDPISQVLAGFYNKIDRPVLIDATLDYGGMPVYDVFPNSQIDLFAGTAMLVVGRYRDGGQVQGTLSGSMLGATETYAFPLTFPECALNANAFLPRLWAKAKIDALIAQMDDLGYVDPAIVGQIQELAKRYGIQTPWSSYEMGDEAPAGAGGSGYGGSGGSYGGYGQGGSYSGDHGYSGGGLDLSGCQMRPGATTKAIPWTLLGLGLLAAVRRRRHA